MRLEVRKYLYDMRRAAELLSEFTAGKSDLSMCSGYDYVNQAVMENVN